MQTGRTAACRCNCLRVFFRYEPRTTSLAVTSPQLLDLVHSAVIVLAWRSRSLELGHEALRSSVHDRHLHIVSVCDASISRIWTCGRNRATRCGLDRTLSTRVLRSDANSLYPIIASTSPITTPKMCDLPQRCVPEAKTNGWDSYDQGQKFRNQCWALTKDCMWQSIRTVPTGLCF